MKTLIVLALTAVLGLTSARDCDLKKETRCRGAVGAICCGTPNATCCSDGFHCCAAGTSCDPDSDTYCTKANGPNAFFKFPIYKGVAESLESLEENF